MIMKRTILIALSLLTIAGGMLAQTGYREDGYEYLYDYDHRVVIRECTFCSEDHQVLWNGDVVRIINDNTYIYRDGRQLTWGNRVWLEHNGMYTVERGDWQYLIDRDGDMTGLSGKVLEMLWDGTVSTKRGDYHYLYTTGNSRLGNAYSLDKIEIYWNGYYGIRQASRYCVADEDGYMMNSLWSESMPELMGNGLFRVERNGRTYLVDTDGTIRY